MIHTRRVGRIGVCSLVAALGFTFFNCSESRAGSEESPKYCLITPKHLRGDVNIVSKDSPSVATLMRVSGKRIKGFFDGKMEKLGFGTPECFFIGGSVSSHPIDGVRHSNTGPSSKPGRSDSLDMSGSDFFPTVGYFSRVSDKGKKSVALGVGFKEGRVGELSDDDGTGRPEAKVALMIGFGF